MNRAVFVGDGASACIAEVENAQSPVNETNAFLDEDAMIIGATAGHGQGHSGESRLIRPPAVRVPNPPDSAHFFFSGPKGLRRLGRLKENPIGVVSGSHVVDRAFSAGVDEI